MNKRFFDIAINVSKQMSFAQKFMAIIAMLSIPLLFLLVVLLIDTNSSIQKTQKEIQGIQSLEMLISTIYRIQDFRDHAVLQEVNLDSELIKFISDEKHFISTQIEQLSNNLFHQQPASINIQTQIENIKFEWQLLNESQAVMRGGIESQFLHFDKVVLELQLLAKVITFESALIHDDSPINFYLINNFVNEAPKIYKNIGFLRAAGTYALSMPTVDSYTYHTLEKLAAQTEDNISLNNYSSSHIALYLNENSDIKGGMAELLNSAKKLLNYTYEQILDEPELLPNWKEYLEFYSNEIKKMREFDTLILKYVGVQLDNRSSEQKFKFAALVIVTLMLYLVIVYFVYGIYLQLKATLSNYSQKAMALAQGDLNTRINDMSKDEFGDLANTFNEMAEIISVNQSKLVEAEKVGSLSRMITGVAHEINTPLGIIISSYSLNKSAIENLNNLFTNEELDEDDLKEFIQSSQNTEVLIDKNLNKVVNLIETFKQVNSSLNVSPQKGVELLSLIEFAYLPIEESHKDIEFSINGTECEIDTDVNLLTQVISNIIENAIEHGLKDTANKQISITVNDSNEQVNLSIQDNGKGISEEEISKIFEPFYTTGRINGKVGLGMHIVYIIVSQSLNGTIKISSDLNKFTRLDITLPKHRDDCEEIDIDLDDFI
ncbi:ATP-binding protein [Pseudoalteromonas sp. SS15]|uniref:ATP-binding protein n=1 Tax=Pseudoalteromonas sp. SS15 TaxID=3139393 RepID=UPI003BA98CAD